MDHDMIIPNILASITPKKNSASKCRCLQPTTIMGPHYQTWMPSTVVFPTGFTHCLARPSVVSGREPSSLVGNQRKCSKMSTWLGKWWSNDKPQDGMLNPIFRATHFHWLSRLHFFLKFGSNSPRGEVEVGPCPLGPGRLHLFGNSLVDHQGIWRIPLDPGFWAPHFHRMLTISGCQAPQKMVHTKYGQCKSEHLVTLGFSTSHPCGAHASMLPMCCRNIQVSSFGHLSGPHFFPWPPLGPSTSGRCWHIPSLHWALPALKTQPFGVPLGPKWEILCARCLMGFLEFLSNLAAPQKKITSTGSIQVLWKPWKP